MGGDPARIRGAAGCQADDVGVGGEKPMQNSVFWSIFLRLFLGGNR
jgi:hypothetical protein